jgi:hypothetical protein
VGRVCAGACAACELRVRSRAFRVRSWVRVLTCVGLRCLEAGALCSAVTRGAWGALVRREPGQGDVAWGGALCSWCMRGWAKQLCLKALSRRKTAEPKPQPPCNTPFPQRCRHHLLPRPRPLTSEGLRWQGRFNQGRMEDYNLVSPRTNFPSKPAERVRERTTRAPVSHHQVWQQIGMSPTHKRSASTFRVFELQGDST